MKYELSQHAKDVLHEREIPLEWMERVLGKPERTEADAVDGELEHRLGRISEHGDRVLRVIIRLAADPVLIVTVCFDRGMRGRL